MVSLLLFLQQNANEYRNALTAVSSHFLNAFMQAWFVFEVEIELFVKEPGLRN